MTPINSVDQNHSSFTDTVSVEVSRVINSFKRTSDVFDSSDHSSDDDMYSNYLDKYTKRVNVKNKSSSFVSTADYQCEENVKCKLRRDSLDLDDPLLGEDDTTSWQQRLEKRAKKAIEEEEREKRIALEELERIARVVDVEPGAKPAHYYCTPALEDAENNIRCMRNCSPPVFNQSHVNTSGASSKPKISESKDVTTVSLMVKDLEDATTRSEILIWEYHKPLLELRDKIARQWDCNIESVEMTVAVNDIETVISEEATPKSLKLEQNRIAVISVFRIDKIHSHGVENANMIYLKYQLRNTRPTLICVNKEELFSNIKKKIQMDLKLLGSFMHLVFDDKEIHDSDTPENLGMENNDCIDVYLQ